LSFSHSTSQGHLAGAILPLTLALRNDSDEKTRANAAGALGNLARNGGMLCRELVRHGAMAALLTAGGPESAPEAPRRIAIFSTGTLVAWPDIRAYLDRDRPVRARLENVIRDGLASDDVTIARYAARLRTKLRPQQLAGGDENNG